MTHLKTIKYAFLFLLVGLLTSCGDSDKKPIEGKRYSVLESEVMLRSDLDPGSIDISLPSSERIEAWEQHDFCSTHHIPHADQNLTGKVAWSVSIGAGKTSTRTIVSPPVTDGTHVYTIDARGLIQCRLLETGDLVWEKDKNTHESASKTEDEEVSYPSAEDHIGGGITLDKEGLYVAYSNGLVEKLDTQTEKVIWHSKLQDLLRSNPLVHKNKLYVISSNNKIISLNKETGALAWTNEGREESLSFIGGAAPAVNDKIVIAPYSSGEVCAHYPPNGLQFWQDTALSFKSLDSKSMIAQLLAHPVIHKDSVIVVSHGDLSTAIDIKTGQRLWQKPFGGVQTPFVTDDFIFMITSANDLICLTRASGKIIWVHPLSMYEDQEKKKDRILWYGPVLTGGRLMIVSSIGDVTFLSPQDGQLLETNKLGKKFIFAPVLIKDKALLISQNGDLTALE